MTIGPFLLESSLVTHTDESYAVRVSPRRATGRPGLVYSGDCGRADDLAPLVRAGRHAAHRGRLRAGPGPGRRPASRRPAVGALAARDPARPRPADAPPDAPRSGGDGRLGAGRATTVRWRSSPTGTPGPSDAHAARGAASGGVAAVRDRGRQIMSAGARRAGPRRSVRLERGATTAGGEPPSGSRASGAGSPRGCRRSPGGRSASCRRPASRRSGASRSAAG